MHICSMRMLQICLNSMFVETPFCNTTIEYIQNLNFNQKTYFLEYIQKTNIWWHLKYFDDPFYVFKPTTLHK